MSQHTTIIAECGSCHDNVFSRALSLIEVAKACDADVCKFQFWSSSKRLAERRRAPEYEAIYERYALPQAWLPALKGHCDDVGIEFMATCYLPEDLAVVAPYVRRFKIASFESHNLEFIAAHVGYGKDIVISTGMSSLEEMATVGTDLARSGAMRTFHERESRVRYLHCVSAYPAPVDEMNLSVLSRDASGARFMDGLSDHTRHPWTGALAVAAGATILERHLRLDTTDPANPDYVVASEPALFAEYVANVRVAEAMLGDGVKRAMPSESEMAKYRVRV